MREELRGLEEFQKIGLEEIKELAVSDRLEIKFIFHKKELPKILQELKHTYKVLEANGEKWRRYENIYFDTIEYEFYKDHHNGRANRFKIRQRRYPGSGESFLEIKQKAQNGRSSKKRMKVGSGSTEQIQNAFLQKNLALDPTKIFPSLKVSYRRCTLVNAEHSERITLDTDLSISQNDQHKHFEKLVIAELKQGNKFTSFFKEVMKKRGIREVPISKYCLGIASLVPGIKTNNFKPLLNTINTKIV